MGIWVKFLTWVQNAGSFFFIAVFLGLIILTIVFSVLKLSKVPVIGILVSSIACMLFTIPLVTSFNYMTEVKAKSLAVTQKREELKAVKTQLENEMLKKQNLELENQRLNLEIKEKSLSEEINLLKNAQVSVTSLNEICELALLETEMNQTEVVKKQIGSLKDGKGVFADKIQTEYLGITTHEIDAKYGVDLKTLRISEGKDKKLHIFGITPVYIGSKKHKTNNVLKEIRQNDIKNNVVQATRVLSDKENIRLANTMNEDAEKQFQSRLEKGIETKYMDDAVTRLAQNYIKVTLAPLQKEIVFERGTGITEKAVPLMEYLETRIKEKEAEMQASDK